MAFVWGNLSHLLINFQSNPWNSFLGDCSVVDQYLAEKPISLKWFFAHYVNVFLRAVGQVSIWHLFYLNKLTYNELITSRNWWFPRLFYISLFFNVAGICKQSLIRINHSVGTIFARLENRSWLYYRRNCCYLCWAGKNCFVFYFENHGLENVTYFMNNQFLKLYHFRFYRFILGLWWEMGWPRLMLC